MPIVFACQNCRTPLSAEPGQIGQLVRCPTCLTTLRVPQPEMAAVGAAPTESAEADLQIAPPPTHPPPPLSSAMTSGRGSSKRYPFYCPYCSSRLEATESNAAQDGQCPTCGNSITIPILDRYGRLIDPKTKEIIKQDPHPVHAYAAAGDRAPHIVGNPAGGKSIQCVRCNALSPITANICQNVACRMPFTMEGTTFEAGSASNGFCVASLVLGVVGLPTCFVIVPALLAVIFGILGLARINQKGGGGRGMAIAGITLGGLGLLIGVWHYI